jgi:hypothetical protein
MIGIPLGLLYANVGEWVLHKYVLHRLGRRQGSFWDYHWHEHHRAAWKNDFRDPAYEQPVFGRHAQGREAIQVAGLALLHLPLFPIAPFFVGTAVYCAWNYFRVHKLSHLDPVWAWKHLPWHVDHHLGPNPEANWCVTRPWADVLFGTREPWVGTPREAEDQARRAALKARRATRAAP